MENVPPTHVLVSTRLHQVWDDDWTHPVHRNIGSIVDAIQGGRQWRQCAAISRQRSPVENITKHLQNRQGPGCKKRSAVKLEKG